MRSCPQRGVILRLATVRAPAAPAARPRSPKSRALRHNATQARAQHQYSLANRPNAQADADVAALRVAPATPRAVSAARACCQAAHAPLSPAHHQPPPDRRPAAGQPCAASTESLSAPQASSRAAPAHLAHAQRAHLTPLHHGASAHAASSAHRAASPADTSRPTAATAAAGAARHHQFTTARRPYAVHVREPAQPRPVQPVRDVAGVSDAHPALSPKPPATPSAVSTPCASRQAAHAPLSRADRPEAHEGRPAAVQALRRPRGARCQPVRLPLRSRCVLERTHHAHHHHGAHTQASL
jgi:hypothetical protein